MVVVKESKSNGKYVASDPGVCGRDRGGVVNDMHVASVPGKFGRGGGGVTPPPEASSMDVAVKERQCCKRASREASKSTANRYEKAATGAA